MPDQSPYFPLKVELDYSYSLGELKPYFDALAESRALGSICPKCDKVSFPPRILCDDGQTETEWKELDGTGKIIEFTTGKDANGEYVSFALIQMNEASNLCLGRLQDAGLNIGDQVRIHALEMDVAHPAQRVVFKKY